MFSDGAWQPCPLCGWLYTGPDRPPSIPRRVCPAGRPPAPAPAPASLDDRLADKRALGLAEASAEICAGRLAECRAPCPFWRGDHCGQLATGCASTWGEQYLRALVAAAPFCDPWRRLEGAATAPKK